ncbi:MAG: anti-sigma factor [Ardenticatenaceae bacterium]|nr:anti-sigma factor [Ardenticatenaceae bacterium]
MQQTEHQTIIDLIPAYALNSLDAEDAEMVAQHLAACPDCQAELAAFAGVVDALPLAAADVEPSTALKEQLMRQIRVKTGEETAVSPQTTPPTIWQQFIRALSDFIAGPRWQPAAVLAVLVLLIGSFFIWQRASVPPTQFVLTATEAAPEAQGIIEVMGDGRQATLTVTGLPELDPANQYQLWLIQDGQRTSGGIFSVQADGSQTITIDAPQPLPDYAAFGITIEPAGGSPGPTGERVLGFNL